MRYLHEMHVSERSESEVCIFYSFHETSEDFKQSQKVKTHLSRTKPSCPNLLGDGNELVLHRVDNVDVFIPQALQSKF